MDSLQWLSVSRFWLQRNFQPLQLAQGSFLTENQMLKKNFFWCQKRWNFLDFYSFQNINLGDFCYKNFPCLNFWFKLLSKMMLEFWGRFVKMNLGGWNDTTIICLLKVNSPDKKLTNQTSVQWVNPQRNFSESPTCYTKLTTPTPFCVLCWKQQVTNLWRIGGTLLIY